MMVEKMKSINPGKQRKELYNAPQHLKRKWIAAHLEENLLLKYDKRISSCEISLKLLNIDGVKDYDSITRYNRRYNRRI